MHMHFYCYVIEGTAYLLDRKEEWCYSETQHVVTVPSNLYVNMMNFVLEQNMDKLWLYTNIQYMKYCRVPGLLKLSFLSLTIF